MKNPFKKKTKAIGVSCRIENVSTVKIPESTKLLIIGSNLEKYAPAPIVFFDIIKPKWWQFWKKKQYIKAVELEYERFHEVFGKSSDITNLIDQKKKVDKLNLIN